MESIHCIVEAFRTVTPLFRDKIKITFCPGLLGLTLVAAMTGLMWQMIIIVTIPRLQRPHRRVSMTADLSVPHLLT